MTRGEVELEFFQKAGGLDEHIVMMMADEIVRLREQLTYQTITLTAEHQRAERILATLREPSKAVMKAADSHSDVVWVIRAAVAAAEREASA